jgi:hypothetical protein
LSLCADSGQGRGWGYGRRIRWRVRAFYFGKIKIKVELKIDHIFEPMMRKSISVDETLHLLGEIAILFVMFVGGPY